MTSSAHRRRSYSARQHEQREVRIRIERHVPAHQINLVRRPIADNCLCPGCYFVATEQSELCLRCTMEACTHEENNHG